jgi:hypothetical protein
MVAAAIVGGGTALGVGAQVYGANAAANAQKSAANAAINEQQQMFNTTQANLAPFRTTGQAAEATLSNLLTGPSASQTATLESLPGYQFALGQGLQSTQSAAAARGLGTSGAALMGAANYATGLANQSYGTYAGLLQQQANMGESAAAQTGAFGTQTANAVSSDLTSIGAANAGAALGSANALNAPFAGSTNLLLQSLLGVNNSGGGGLYGKHN